MAQEIERKFLVKGEFMDKVVKSMRISQGYICTLPGRSVRVRIKDDKGYLTIKGASTDNGLSRFEWEKEISLEDANDLFKLCEPGAIDKTRHLIPAGKHTYEVDVFHGDNDGLVMAEIELNSEDEAFEKPEWLGEEVTGDRHFYNSFLTKNPFKGWGKKQ